MSPPSMIRAITQWAGHATVSRGLPKKSFLVYEHGGDKQKTAAENSAHRKSRKKISKNPSKYGILGKNN